MTGRAKGLPALLAAVLSSSLIGLDGMMTPLVLPAITQDPDAGPTMQQWPPAAFLLPLAGLLLVSGALGDVYDRWRVFGFGAAGFCVAALVCALAPNPGLPIADRLVQGAGAALMVPGALAVISTTFDGAAQGRAIARWSGWSGPSVIAGPLLAGALLEVGTWRYVYGALALLAALVVALIAYAAPARERRAEATVDRGAVLAVPAVAGPVFALIQGPSLGWTDPLILTAAAAGLASAAAFLWWEARAPRPLLPLELFRIRTFTVLNAVTFLLYGGLVCSGFYTVLFLRQTAGYSPTAAGLTAAVPLMVVLLLSGRAGALADRLGHRWLIAGGSLVSGAGQLLMLRAGAEPRFLAEVLPAMLVHGAGLALLVAPLTAGVLGAAGPEHAGAASGIDNAVARTGSLLGITVVGLVISAQSTASLERASAPPAVVEQARDHPLAIVPPENLPPPEIPHARKALQGAASDAFHAATAVLGGLGIAAGLLAAIGTGRRRPGDHRPADAVPLAGRTAPTRNKGCCGDRTVPRPGSPPGGVEREMAAVHRGPGTHAFNAAPPVALSCRP
ncbi:MFS transporter [Actinomadura sp. LOL_011]|uniref:MFS transporter n=1 Tax=Actinomadura sp. LOL_011 TaxID=3345410 RepID=UPI003A80054A